MVFAEEIKGLQFGGAEYPGDHRSVIVENVVKMDVFLVGITVEI
jgi:hypothetical protein